MRTFKIIMATFLVAITAFNAYFQYLMANYDVFRADLFSFGMAVILLLVFLTHDYNVKK